MKAFHWCGAVLRRWLPLRWEPGWKTIVVASMGLALGGTWAADQFLQVQYEGPRQPLLSSRMGTAADPRNATNRLSLGDPAPDFNLQSLEDHHLVHLASIRKHRPVILIFGSFTCDLFCKRIVQVERLYQAFHDRAEFLCVYIQEAGHAIPGREFILRESRSQQPWAGQRRWQILHGALAAQSFTMPCVLDGDDYPTQKAYGAWPLRLVVVDVMGRVSLDLGFGLGRNGWDLRTVETWLQAHT